jgi:hypothetical protein
MSETAKNTAAKGESSKRGATHDEPAAPGRATAFAFAPIAVDATLEAWRTCFAATQQSLDSGRKAMSGGFRLPEGARLPAFAGWQRALEGGEQGLSTFSAEWLAGAREGVEHANHLLDESTRLGKASLAWQLELAEKTVAESLAWLRAGAAFGSASDA